MFAPVLDRVLGLIASRMPIPSDALRRAFEAAGLGASWLPPKVIRQAAMFLSRPATFDTVLLEGVELVVPEGRFTPQK